jgi:hypothetical protein
MKGTRTFSLDHGFARAARDLKVRVPFMKSGFSRKLRGSPRFEVK